MYKLFLIFAVILLTSCSQEKPADKISPGTELQHIASILPQGWTSVKIANISSNDYPHGLNKPLAIVKFQNPSLNFEAPGNVFYNASLTLCFYNITEKQSIMATIEKESIFSWCIPQYYAETNSYLIVTSPCYINRGVYTDDAQAKIAPLHSELKEFFDSYR